MAQGGSLTGWDHVGRNLQHLREQIAEAAERAHRDPAEVQLVAVTKTVPLEGIRAAAEAGQTIFGENRVQEALPKIEALQSAGARFHLVGHLQTNKAKRATAFDMIESVDSVRVAVALDRYLSKPLRVLLEVNVAQEASKHGFAADDLADALAVMAPLPHIKVEGLMTVAPLVAEPEAVRPIFRQMRQLRDEHGLATLSMGMTNDFPVAIAEGATMVRIGRAIFGDR